MATSYVCDSCSGAPLLGGLLPAIEPDHCHGRSDRPAPKGVLGGYHCSCPCRYGPSELHALAHRQFPGDKDRAIARYNELMREAGHIVKREPGDTSPLLPCGWDPREGVREQD